MHYMLFFPRASLPENKAGDVKAILNHHDMGDLADGSPVLSSVVDGGPDGGPGVLISWGKAGFVKLHEQLWRNVPGHPFYVGTDKTGKVSPADLARTPNYRGYNVKLADGQQWIIPVAREFPRKYELQEDGEAEAVMAGQFAEFFDYSYEVVLEQWLGGVVEPEHTEVCRFCARALGFNYRLNYLIAMTLGLFDETVYRGVAHAVCDVPSLEAVLAQKKTDG